MKAHQLTRAQAGQVQCILGEVFGLSEEELAQRLDPGKWMLWGVPREDEPERYQALVCFYNLGQDPPPSLDSELLPLLSYEGFAYYGLREFWYAGEDENLFRYGRLVLEEVLCFLRENKDFYVLETEVGDLEEPLSRLLLEFDFHPRGNPFLKMELTVPPWSGPLPVVPAPWEVVSFAELGSLPLDELIACYEAIFPEGTAGDPERLRTLVQDRRFDRKGSCVIYHSEGSRRKLIGFALVLRSVKREERWIEAVGIHHAQRAGGAFLSSAPVILARLARQKVRRLQGQVRASNHPMLSILKARMFRARTSESWQTLLKAGRGKSPAPKEGPS